MDFESPTGLLYHTYNSLFVSLPFHDIAETGTLLAIFAKHCDHGFDNHKTPVQIIEEFWEEYYEKASFEERQNVLFYFIQYIERQVVVFDSVEDALFTEAHEMEGPGSLRHLLSLLNTDGKQERLLQKIQDYSIRLVLTAHPTQFYPGKVLGIINDLSKEIKGNNLQRIRLLLMQLGKTAFVNREKPTPFDEAVSLGWYMENVFFYTLPNILFRLLSSLGQDVTTFQNPHLLTLGFWPGGDRDGNPFVIESTTKLVAERLREAILRGYYREIRILKRRLTFAGTEDCITKAELKIYDTLYKPQGNRYHSCLELIADLLEARQTLIEDHDRLFLEELDLFILRVRVFGFYFASLDIRQDSRKHAEVWAAIVANWANQHPDFDPKKFSEGDEETRINRLLSTPFSIDENDYTDEFVRETIRSFRVIPTIQQQNGEIGCHRYIISNCQNAYNVAEVLALAQLTWSDESKAKSYRLEAQIPLDVVPLFETIEDLANCAAVMDLLYRNAFYKNHLAARANVQTIMLGFSDGTKDGGYLRANWSIYCAKEALTRVSRAHGVSVVFFDGRGGPPGRGGGNNASFYAAHGANIESKAIQVTIQGQTVSSTYGTQDAARFNIERLLSAGLQQSIVPGREKEEMGADAHKLMDELASAAYTAYLELKNHPDFVPYLEKMTPLKWYGDSKIASRPTKRGTDALKFEDLRAIPFVGAWAQMKQNVPGYYGVGSAIASFPQGRRRKLIKDLYKESLFFRTLLENSMQSLSKSNFKVTKYLAEHPDFGDFWKLLETEYVRTNELIREITGEQELLSENPISRSSIKLREDIVLPLITIQQYGLQKLEGGNLSEAEAELYRKMVLRAMFGIINAARNAA